MSTTTLHGNAVMDDLFDALCAAGIELKPNALLPVDRVQAVTPLLVADDPALAGLAPAAWVREQVRRGAGHALLLGLVGHGLSSQVWRCCVATPAVVVAAEVALPQLGDAAGAAVDADACRAVWALTGRVLEAASRYHGERVAMAFSERDGSAALPASEWPSGGTRLPVNALVFSDMLARLSN